MTTATQAAETGKTESPMEKKETGERLLQQLPEMISNTSFQLALLPVVSDVILTRLDKDTGTTLKQSAPEAYYTIRAQLKGLVESARKAATELEIFLNKEEAVNG